MSEGLHPEQGKALRRMTQAQWLKVGFAFLEDLRLLKATALRARHRDWTEAQIEQALRDFILHGSS